jgi:uncharacterized protein involved in cysteine biosynthesis
MKLIFSSVIIFFFIISTVGNVYSPFWDKIKHCIYIYILVCVADTAEKIEACLEGITNTNEVVASIANDINSLIHVNTKKMRVGTKVLNMYIYRRISRTPKKYKKYNSNYTKMEN